MIELLEMLLRHPGTLVALPTAAFCGGYLFGAVLNASTHYRRGYAEGKADACDDWETVIPREGTAHTRMAPPVAECHH